MIGKGKGRGKGRVKGYDRDIWKGSAPHIGENPDYGPVVNTVVISTFIVRNKHTVITHMQHPPSL